MIGKEVRPCQGKLTFPESFRFSKKLGLNGLLSENSDKWEWEIKSSF